MSGNNYEIGAFIKLDGEAEYRKSISNATTSIRELQSESKLIEEQFRGQGNTMEALKAKHEVLSKALDAHKRKEEELKKVLDNAKKNQENIGKGLEKLLGQWDEENEKLEELKKTYGESSEEVKKQEEKVKELSETIQKGERNYETAGNRIQRWQTQLNDAQAETIRANRALEQNEQYLNEAENATDGCAKSIDKFGKEVQESTEDLEEQGKTLTDWKDKFANAVAIKSVDIATKALSAMADKAKEAAGYVLDVGMSFEAAMSSVEALSGASGSSLEALSDKAKELGSSTAFTATEAADALGNMALAGWDTQQMLGGIDGVLQLAAAGGMELAAASDAVAGYLAAFGMEASESARLADVMAYAQANSKTTTQQLSEAYGTCATNMTSAGQEMETTTALLEGLAKVNNTGSAAGTKLSAVMAQITAKMKDGKIAIGNTKVEVLDANGNFRDMIDIVADIEKALDGMGGGMRSTALATTFNRTSLNGLNDLLKVGSDQIRKYREGLENCSGAAADMAATMQDNLQGKVTILQSALEGLGVSAYEKFSGPMQGAVEKATGIIEQLTEKMNNGELGRAFESLAESLGDNVDILDDVADGLIWIIENGDLIIVTLKGIVAGLAMYKAVTAITGVIGALQTMHAALKAAEGAQVALNLAQMASPVGLVTAGVAALGVALVSLANSKMKKVKTESEKTAEEVENLSGRIDDLKTSLKEEVQAQKEEITSTKAQYANYQKMVDKAYDLNDAIKKGTMTEKQANAAKAQMGYYVRQLNSEMPGLNLEIDEQNGLIKQGREETDKYVESLRQKAIAAALEDQLTDLYKKQAEAQMSVAEAEVAKADAHENATEATKKATRYQNAYNEKVELGNRDAYDAVNGQGAYAKAVEEIAKKYEMSTDELEKAGDTAADAAKEAENYKNAEETATEEIEKATDAEKEANEELIRKAKALKKMGRLSDEEFTKITGIVLDNTDAMKDNADAAEDAADAAENYAESAGEIIVSSDAQEKALESLRGKFEEVKSSIEQSMDVNMFEKFNGGETYDLDTLSDNLEGRRKAMENWEENMRTLAGEIGGNMNTQFFDELLEMGPDQAANFVQQLVDNLNNEGGEELKRLADQWAGALSDRETYAENLANLQSLFKTAMGEMSNSTELDYSNLEKSLEGAASAAADGGQMISDEIKDAFLQTVEAAKQFGAEIPEGLADKIASGEVSIEEAIAQMKGSMAAQLDFLTELAGEVGIEIPEDIRNGILNGGEEAVRAVAQLQDMILKEQGKSEKEFKESGKKNTKAVGAGTEEAKSEVVSKSDAVMDQAAEAAGSHYMQFREVGENMMAGVAAGMHSNSNLVYRAVERVLTEAKRRANKTTESRSPSRVWRNQVGAYMSQGLALGILDGEKDVVSASVGLARSALQGTQEELDIHSPSGAFKKLGDYVAKGLGIGIKNSKGYPVQAAKNMASEVYKTSEEWIARYLKSHNVAIEQEKKLWKELAKVVKKDSASYKEALKNAAVNDKFMKEVRQKIKKSFDVSEYTKKGKQTVKKSADAYYSDLTKAAKKYVENKAAVDNITLRQQKYVWQQLKKSVKKGTQTYADAAKKIKEINKAIKKEIKNSGDTVEYGVSGSGLDMYKSFYKVSAKAEIEYWQQVKKSSGLTVSQKLEVEKKIFEAQESYNEQRKALEDEYYEKCQEVNDKLKDDIKDLTDEYENAFEERKSAIKSAFGLFDGFKSEADAPEVFLANMQSQVTGYALWMEQLEELEGKHILNDSFLEELREMGPAAAATILSLNTATEEELKAMNRLYEEKDRLAEAQAAKETEALRAETEKRIKEITEEAQKQLDAYKTEYQKASAELSAAISEPLQELAKKATTLGEDATAKLIQGFKKQAESKKTKTELKGIQSTIADGIGDLPAKGKAIGKDTLSGILKGLSNKLEIKKGAKSFVEELEEAIKKEAGIASPSRRFRDVVGKQIPAGVAQGIKDGTKEAADAGADMVGTMLEQAAEQTRRQQDALSEYTANLNTSAGIHALNKLTAAPVPQTPNVTVNNSGVAEMIGGLMAEMRAMREEIRYMKVVLDTGEFVGAVAPAMGDELARQTMRF